MTSEVLTKLWKYKKQLDAFVRRNEDDKVLTMLQKINKLNVSIDMIQETSIGKLVKSISSKKELGIGAKASALVDKWMRLIEEVVDQKYKSACDVEDPPKKTPTKTIANTSTTMSTVMRKSSGNDNSKKAETPENQRQKRKSEIVEERAKPPKQSRTINESVVSQEDENDDDNDGRSASSDDNGRSAPSDDNKKSFLDALGKRSEQRPLPTVKPSDAAGNAADNLQTRADEEEEDEDEEDSCPERQEANGFDFSDEVFESIERVTAMLEERKKALAPKAQVEQDNLGGRTYAVPNLFCGKRVDSSKNIPTFVEKFQHLLYDNIENVEYIGNLPFEILEPVLRKLNPTQLEKFEYFNPTVVQKSDDIWKMHVLLKYPSRKPGEFGSWREVYLDSRDAMKAKLEQSVQKFSTNVAKMKREEHKTKFFDPCMTRIGKKSSSRGQQSGNSMGANGRGVTAFSHKAPLMQKALKMMKPTGRR